MRQVIVNLVTNAIKYSPLNSQVSLKAEMGSDEMIKISVTDHGQGIRTEEIPLLFHEYGLTSSKPTNGEKSTGLGLSIVSKIIEAHGGKVQVRSEFGVGSEFSVAIPA